jgi:hypothetical protein
MYLYPPGTGWPGYTPRALGGEDSSNCKRQTRPLVREGAPYQQTRKCLTVLKYLAISPRWGLDNKTDWPTDRRS